MNKIISNEYERVTKTTAKKLYNDGRDIYLSPCKVYPSNENKYMSPYKVDIVTSGMDFDTLVNHYEYYNCNYSELGKTAFFYIKID